MWGGQQLLHETRPYSSLLAPGRCFLIFKAFLIFYLWFILILYNHVFHKPVTLDKSCDLWSNMVYLICEATTCKHHCRRKPLSLHGLAGHRCPSGWGNDSSPAPGPSTVSNAPAIPGVAALCCHLCSWKVVFLAADMHNTMVWPVCLSQAADMSPNPQQRAGAGGRRQLYMKCRTPLSVPARNTTHWEQSPVLCLQQARFPIKEDSYIPY